MESSAINMVAGVTMLLILLTGTMNVMATAVIANILLSPINRSLGMQKINFAVKASILLVATFLCVSPCPPLTDDETALLWQQRTSGSVFLPAGTRSAQLCGRDSYEQPSRGRAVRTHNMEATAYTWTGSRTATGTWPSRGTVAVDPRVIPLGSELYVEGYGPTVAADTGGDIKGQRIDLYMESYEEAIQFGRRQVLVEVLKER